MKKAILNFISSFSFVNQYFSGIATIFMLHRVSKIDKNKLLPNENMKVSPEFLESFILELKRKGYEFISLDRLYEMLINNEKVKKQIVFTFDDGYKDNYEIAYPIFKKYNVPFTIYITTAFPENNVILWWYILEDLLISNNEIIIENEKIICKTKEKKEKAFLILREKILNLNQNNLLTELKKLFNKYEIDFFDKNKELCLNWQQIIELSKEPLCSIGGHTKNHLVFKQLPEEEIINEIVEANNLIESKTGKKVEHFAYPFGSRNEITKREIDIVKKLGFKTVVTTRVGNIYSEHKDYLECLPRIMLTENFNIESIGKVRKEKIVTI